MSDVNATLPEVTITASRLPATAATPPSGGPLPSVGYPTCYVDIYPYEGGQYTLSSTNGNLLSCRTSKRLFDQGSGTFNLLLAPGGPLGTGASPQWLDILTPMSLVVIAMQRLGRANIVMIGVVLSVSENVIWESGRPVQRGTAVQGRDFSHIWQQPDFYGTLFILSQSSLLGAGSAAGYILQQGFSQQTIQDAAKTWYNKIMIGTQAVPGVLSKLNFAYQGQRVPFADIMATFFDTYHGLEVDIPTAQMWAVLSGSWMETFSALYPFPWFELFVSTAEAGSYGEVAATTEITSSQPGTPAASPCVVARFSPLPTLGGPTGQFTTDLSEWQTLKINTLDTIQPISRGVMFSEAEVKNFFAINPRFIASLWGNTNNSNTQWLYQFGVWLDLASVARYGYRPFIANVDWFADLDGNAAKSTQAGGGQNEFATTVGIIALKAAGYFESAPLMGAGSVVTNLRPDIKIGTRLQFPMPKDMESWEFYIDGVDHEFAFGGQTTTTLSLSRGLPSSVYDDQDLMTAIMSGNAMRKDGVYTKGLQAGALKPLQVFNTGSGPDMLSSLSGVFNAAGAK